MKRFVCIVLALVMALGIAGIARADEGKSNGFGFTIEEFTAAYNEQKKIPLELEAESFYASENSANMLFARLNVQKNVTLYLGWAEGETEINTVGVIMGSGTQPPLEEFFSFTDIVMSIACPDLTPSERNDFMLATIIQGFNQGFTIQAGYSYTVGKMNDYQMTYYLQPENMRQFKITKAN